PATATPPDAVSPSQSPPAAQQPPKSTPQRPDPPESKSPPRRWLGLDHLGVLQVLGAIALSLIALFSSYDHITLFGRTLQLKQQWGIPFIAASLATVVVDAQLASRSRLRTAQDAARMADEAARERNLAGEERERADRERNQAAEARERQRQATARLDRCALLSARVLLDPSASNRARLHSCLDVMGQRPEAEEGDGEG
ncbi:MAG: hypothetical protein ACKN89_12035, partial [Cyanobium sp.]